MGDSSTRVLRNGLMREFFLLLIMIFSKNGNVGNRDVMLHDTRVW